MLHDFTCSTYKLTSFLKMYSLEVLIGMYYSVGRIRGRRARVTLTTTSRGQAPTSRHSSRCSMPKASTPMRWLPSLVPTLLVWLVVDSSEDASTTIPTSIPPSPNSGETTVRSQAATRTWPLSTRPPRGSTTNISKTWLNSADCYIRTKSSSTAAHKTPWFRLTVKVS